MANPMIPRDRVHEWSEAIAEKPDDHGTALPRLLKDHKRLTKWVSEQGENMHPATGGIANYMISVVARIFDLSGGKLKGATWDQIRAVEKRVMAQVGPLLPVDDGFVERARGAERSQPHILDEALMALFSSEVGEGEEEPDQGELLKIYLMMWVATEVLNGNWRAPKDFVGETSYTYVHIEPRKPEAAEA